MGRVGQQAARVLFGSAAVSTLALAAAAPPAAPARSRPAYSVRLSTYRPTAVFQLTYQGAGNWRTVYHSNPPSDPADPAGPRDTNDANDSSTQHWSLRSIGDLTIPTCGRTAHNGPDPCRRIASPKAASGSESATGRVSHRHLDGLFTAQNRSISCALTWTSAKGTLFYPTIRLQYSPTHSTVAITALTPVFDAVNSLPEACQEQGDATDGLFDSYFSPGFSFAPGYGSDRWFTAGTVVIPVNVIHHATRITIPLADTHAGRPPGDCAVTHPSYERCSTGGAWAGVLTFTAR